MDEKSVIAMVSGNPTYNSTQTNITKKSRVVGLNSQNAVITTISETTTHNLQLSNSKINYKNHESKIEINGTEKRKNR
jgi:hypothetical protein